MSEHKESNPKDGAASSRIDLSLFPSTARAYGALAFTEGDLKYGAYNWRVAGVSASVYMAALGRHMDKWYNGEDIDPKTGVHHLANALACVAVLIDALESNTLNDDRPPKLPNPTRFFAEMEERVKHLQASFPRKSERFTEE